MSANQNEFNRRLEVALAHLFVNGFFDSDTFPLSGREKYLSGLATEIRHRFEEAGIEADLAKFRVGRNVGWVMWPVNEHTRCALIGSMVQGSLAPNYTREVGRLVGPSN